MKIYWPILLVAFAFASLVVNAQTGGCGDPRAQICNPGQYADTSGDQTACLACKGNTVANGCTRSCSQCGAGTIPNSDHSGCVAAPPPPPVAWSPHSKPFDLVWDSKHLDYNSLPLNPQWAFQLNPGGLPDFTSICGSAFSGGNSVNNGTLADVCTSQQTTFDIDHSLEEAGGYCQGLINGHLTWMKATYTGSVLWDSWSKDPDFFANLDLADGDYNLLLWDHFPSQNGYTDLNWSSKGEFGIGLEFKDTETVNNAVGPWWVQLRNSDITNTSDTSNTSQMFNNGGGGLPGVVTAFIGIDGVHGGYTESHPVFSIALDVQQAVNQDNTLTENWVYFLRTKGNGGGCSEVYYNWTEPNNTFYIQLPWPNGATSVKATAGNFWAWQTGAPPQAWILGSQDPGFTLIKIQFPTSSYPGTDGQLTLVYSFPPGNKPTTQVGAAIIGDALNGQALSPAAKEKRASSTSGENEDEFNIAEVATRIADPVVKAKFMADAKQALEPLTTVQPSTTPGKAIPMNFDTPLKVEPRPPAGGGRVTALQTSPDPVNKQIHAAIKKLMDTYGPQLGASPSVKK